MEKICQNCGDWYTTKAPNAKYCVPCRKTMDAKRHRDGWAKTKVKRQAEREQAERDKPYLIEQAWMDLAFAIVEQAFRDHDINWLTEFGPEFLAYSGRPLNPMKFENLLEELNGQT